MVLAASSQLRLDTNWVDYSLIALYFAFVLGIGIFAKRAVSSSIDFFLSGRSLPAWVTGLAFISANLGAVEIIGMSANGAQFGIPTVHYFWIGAVPAMLFLGVVMMPFYYGSKVRSVPEFMRRRFGTGAHLVNALSFALAQLLIAGINLYLLAKIVEVILGWNLYISLVGGRHRGPHLHHARWPVRGHLQRGPPVLRDRGGPAAADRRGPQQGRRLRRAQGQDRRDEGRRRPAVVVARHQPHGIDSPVLSVIGLVLGLGFVLSFGYWTTNFVEVQRAMASSSISAAQRAPIIGAFPKMFIPFIVIFPGMIAGVLVGQVADAKKSGSTTFDYNNSLLYLIRDLLPNGMLGVAIAGLLASFMAGMAANISAFNTVFSYDLWQTYVQKDKPDRYYLAVGRWATVAATMIAIGTALFAASYSNIMNYLQTLFGFFNAPLFATFILGMFWKRMTATAGWAGLVSGTAAAIVLAVLGTDVLGGLSIGVLPLSGQGASFTAAGAAFVVDILVSVVVSLATVPREESELRGLVYSLTPKADFHDADEGVLSWYQQPTKLAAVGLVIVIILNIIFW